jgi:hypothetical protein
MKRDFRVDFCLPAIHGLSRAQSQRVSIALDAAICFGVLEAKDGNESMGDRAAVEAKYADCVRRLFELGKSGRS